MDDTKKRVEVPQVPTTASSLIEEGPAIEAKTPCVGELPSLIKDNVSKTHSATVVVFGLDGWPGYRQQSEQKEPPVGEMYEKVHCHNRIAGRCIIQNGGRVTAWHVDVVVGVFWDDESDQSANNSQDSHVRRALKSAIAAISDMEEHNKKGGTDGKKVQWEEEVHTRVGLCSGPAHLILRAGIPEQASSTDGTSIPTSDVFDVLGLPLELAARLQTQAGSDVILIDKPTFFGPKETKETKETRETRENPPLYQGELDKIPFYDLQPAKERETVYHPRVGVVQWNGNTMGALFRPSLPQSLDAKKFTKGVFDQTGVQKLVFVTPPISCNIPGFAEPVEAIAVSLTAKEVPVVEADYKSPSSIEIKELLKDAEEKYRRGKYNEAMDNFRKIYQKDRRDFRSNTRLAQHYHKSGDVEMARKHWDAAKASRPRHPLVWALAATAHLEAYLNHLYDTGKLDRAIVDFARGKELAAEAFDRLQEQYCSCLLAISYFLRAQDTDLKRGIETVKEIENWAVLDPTAQILGNLAQACLTILSSPRTDYTKAEECLKAAKEMHDNANSLAASTLQPTMNGSEIWLAERGLIGLIDLIQYNLHQAQARSPAPSPKPETAVLPSAEEKPEVAPTTTKSG